jgi:hypothetical protein
VPDPFTASDQEILSIAEPVPQASVEAADADTAAPAPETAPPPPSILDQVVYSVRTFGVRTTVVKAVRRVGRKRAGGKV